MERLQYCLATTILPIAGRFHLEGSGLLTVTITGVWLVNQNKISIRQLVEFKGNLRVLLLAVLSVLLAARLDLAQLQELGVGGFLFVAVLIFVARSLSVYLCTLGSSMTRAERIFLCWMAPRGRQQLSILMLIKYAADSL